ncbi:hypothetical protein ACIREO_20185 [Streptomyces sp. NPDC102441]|uniref:hypothetical protein n=1 Tax=Streptomyces sp. NPDC102441 TaxID=3366176 RepID=UPI0038209569
MRSHLAARSARLILAAAAVTALAATTTACGSDDAVDAAGSAAPSAVESSGGSDATSTGSPSSEATSTEASSGEGSTSKTESGGGEKSGYGQSCGTNDLAFTVTSESQAGGYYLVTAKAKSGITCYLDVNTPSVQFGSEADGLASPVGQGGEDPIKLTGSTAAYTGISPKSVNSDDGIEFENVIISLTNDDPDPAELKLPDTANVNKPIVTNWSTDISGAVPIVI